MTPEERLEYVLDAISTEDLIKELNRRVNNMERHNYNG